MPSEWHRGRSGSALGRLACRGALVSLLLGTAGCGLVPAGLADLDTATGNGDTELARGIATVSTQATGSPARPGPDLSASDRAQPGPVARPERAGGLAVRVPLAGDATARDDAVRPTGDATAATLELAGATVGPQTLSEMRGGFVEVDGRRIDFSIELQTFLNGVEQLRSVVTLDNLLNGQGGTVLSGGQQAAATSATRIANGATGTTRVTHTVSPGDLGATVVNSQSGVDVRNLGKIAIEVVNPKNRRSGRPFNAGRGLSLEQERAQRSAIAR